MNRGLKFVIVGIILTITQYLFYTFLAHVIFNNNDLLWLCSGISYIFATILAFVLHSNITWKERKPTNHGIIMFFIWNAITAFAIAPFFTWLFKFNQPIHNFLYSISFGMGFSFTYEFVESTTIFIFVTLITLTLNFLFYDRLVFGKTTKQPAKKELKKKVSTKK